MTDKSGSFHFLLNEYEERQCLINISKRLDLFIRVSPSMLLNL